MKTSVRSQFTDIVRRIKNDDVGSEVAITLPGGHELAAIITRESCSDLGLNVDSAVITLIRSTAIIIAIDLEHVKLSARSCLNDLICEVGHGAASSVTAMSLGNDLGLTVGVTLQSTEQLNLHPDQCVTAIFKADSVVLSVLA